MNEQPLTARQVADFYNVKPGTVLDWHSQGKIPPAAVRRLGGTPGGRLRFLLSEIEAAWGAPAGPSVDVVR